MNVRSVERGFVVSFDSRLVPGASGLLYVGGCVLFALALLFGGGTKQGLWSDALVEVAALPVLAVTVWNLRLLDACLVARYALLLTLAVVAIPLLELVPLPPWLWHMLPGRSQIAAELRLVGLEGAWRPVTLAPRECWMAFLALLPAVTLFLITLQLDARGRRSLILLFLGWTSIGIFLSFIQMAGGPESALRFYSETNPDRAVGFFANANHNALAVSLSVPFLVLMIFTEKRPRISPLNGAFAASLLILAVIAVSLTRSRAGIGLIFLATCLCCFIVLPRGQKQTLRRRSVLIVFCLVAFAAFVVFETGFVALSDRFKAPLSDDLRWGLFQVSYRAALQYLPFGSGLGSFVPIYERFAPLSLVHEAYVNHAHDDWIELLLELGLVWPMVVFAFLIWAAIASWDQWRSRGAAGAGEVSACAVSLLLMAIASMTDYPLRTIAVSCVFGVVSGLLVAPSSERVGADVTRPMPSRSRTERAPS